MNVNYQIFEDLNLVYVAHRGVPSIRDTIDCFSAYLSDPKCKCGQKHFVDLSSVTGVTNDYAEMMKFMARMADQFCGGSTQTLLACYAPSEPARRLAVMGRQSWDGIEQVIYRIFDDRDAALAFLGVPQDFLSQSLDRAG